MNDSFGRRSLTLVLLLLFALPMTALAATPTAQFWEEIGGSASGAGISASELGVVPEHRNTSILVGSDGRPVVAYTDWADIVVRRWNGAEWEIIARPGGGHLPQLAMDGSGRIYLAWMGFVPEMQSWEVFLLVRDAAGGDWQELGGSAAGGGISGADGRANVNSFSKPAWRTAPRAASRSIILFRKLRWQTAAGPPLSASWSQTTAPLRGA